MFGLNASTQEEGANKGLTAVVLMAGAGLLVWALTKKPSQAAVVQQKVEDMSGDVLQALLAKAHADPLALTSEEIQVWGQVAPDDFGAVLSALHPTDSQRILAILNKTKYVPPSVEQIQAWEARQGGGGGAPQVVPAPAPGQPGYGVLLDSTGPGAGAENA